VSTVPAARQPAGTDGLGRSEAEAPAAVSRGPAGDL
jgi:hypothetical protein